MRHGLVQGKLDELEVSCLKVFVLGSWIFLYILFGHRMSIQLLSSNSFYKFKLVTHNMIEYGEMHSPLGCAQTEFLQQHVSISPVKMSLINNLK